MLAPKTGVGARPHRVTFQNPGPAVPDGDGGFTQAWVDLDPPQLFVAIEAATRLAYERNVPVGTSIYTATHLVKGPFHPGVTTKTRILYTTPAGSRELHVNAVTDIDTESVEMSLLCTELLP
jgi:head-tail adaptor